MSLLKKLFSKTDTAPSIPAKVFVDRAPRLRPTDLHEVAFQLEDGTPVSLLNLSRTGLALQQGTTGAWPGINTILRGTLQLSRQSFAVQIELMNTRGTIAGFRFHQPESTFSASLDEHFRLEFSALRMTKIDPKVLKAEPEGEPQWYRGADTSELYLVSRGSEVLNFVLSFIELRMEYSETGSPKAFRRIGKGIDKRAYDETDYERVSLDAEMLKMVARFLSGIESLPKEHHAAILKILSSRAQI